MAEDEDLELEQEDGGARLRPFWSGTISFGLVSVPVDLYPATRPKRVSLRMLSPEGVPLARRYYDERHDREIEREEIVRGFEMDDGEMVLVTDEELEALEPDKTRDIDLRRFVPAEAIDARFFNRGYFLAPSGESTKAYRLLAAVMEETKRAGIATFVMRGRSYVVAIVSQEGSLRAMTLRYHDEVRSPADVGLPEIETADAETVTRYQQAMTRLREKELEPDELVDRGSERLRELAQSKLMRGRDVYRVDADEVEPEDEEAEIIDIMELLRRSLGQPAKA